jgi:hypothetical protein
LLLSAVSSRSQKQETLMAKAFILWLLGVPIIVIIALFAFHVI